MTDEKQPHEIRSIDESSEKLVIVVDQVTRREIIGLLIFLHAAVGLSIGLAIINKYFFTSMLVGAIVVGVLTSLYLWLFTTAHKHPIFISLDSHKFLNVNGRLFFSRSKDFTGSMRIAAGEYFSTKTRWEIDHEMEPNIVRVHYLTLQDGYNVFPAIFRGKGSLVRYLANRLNSWLQKVPG